MKHVIHETLRRTSIAMAISAMLGGGSAFAQTEGGGNASSATAQRTAAQDAPASAQAGARTAGGLSLEEIVVTAQRRSESLQDVPVAITALSADAIARAGIQTSQDLTVATPGLTMTTSRSGLTPYLRGVGTQAAITDGSVAMYVDNVYYTSAFGAIFGLNNVERVEVLKGPQGTLFGRNATGGLMHVITRDPTDTPELNATVGYGNYDTVMGSLYASGGIASGVAASLALYSSDQREGWGKNVFLDEDVNLRKEWAARAKVKAELGDATTFVLSGDYVFVESDQGNARQILPGTIGLGGVPFSGSIYDTNSNISFDGSGFNGNGYNNAQFGEGTENNQWGVSGVLTHELSDQLSLTSTTAYREYDSGTYLDNDLSPANNTDPFFGDKADSLQQEVLLNGTTDSFQWTAGGIYYYAHSGYDPFIFSSTSVPPLNARREAVVTTESYALFGQGSYDLTDRTTLTLGARYTIDRLKIEASAVAMPGHPLPVGTPIPALSTDGQPHDRTHADWEEPTWRISLDHRLTPDVLAYVSYNRGYKSGAFNVGTPPVPANAPLGDAVDPETLDAFEVGLKSDLFGGLVRLNSSAYYYDYKNIQLIQLAANGTSATIFNAGAARITGLEVEGTFVPPIPVGRLELRVATSVVDGEYTELSNVPGTTPRTAPPWGNIGTVVVDGSGNHLIRTPDFTSTVGLDYSVPVLTDYETGVSLNWLHNGRMYWEVDNRVSQAATDVVNAQVFFGRAGGDWRVRLWGRNLTDEEYYSTFNSATFGDGGAPAAPLTYGVAVDVKFGGE